jgi:hypothetical protein
MPHGIKLSANNDYSKLPNARQLVFPLDVEILIPNDDSVRLLRYVLGQIDLSALEIAYADYLGKRRAE